MTDQDERELQTELARLQQEHRDLDAAIDALHQSPAPDLLRLQRLKKRKLQLRDRIAFIEDQITPDIIAGPARPTTARHRRFEVPASGGKSGSGNFWSQRGTSDNASTQDFRSPQN
jgi:hypothetical protein